MKLLPSLGIALLFAACARPPIESLHPIPVSAVPDSGGDQRVGAAASALDWDEQVRVFAALVRGFFRPTGRQVRLIDPRPLAPRRSADDSVTADPDWSGDIARVTGLRRVCPADDDAGCAGRPGGVLRMSPAYASGRDTATVWVTYTPVTDAHRPSGPAFGEMRFTMVKRDGDWAIASRLNAVRPLR